MQPHRQTPACLIHLAALAYFLGLGLLFTWPAAVRPGQIIGQPGDNLYFAFLVRWFSSVIPAGQPWFFAPLLNYPQGFNLAFTDMSLAAVLPGSLVQLFAGPAAGYTVAMLLSYPLAGWGMFAWVRRLTGSIPAALIAGSAYCLLPWHTARVLAGHLNQATIQWIPFFFWGLSELIAARRFALKPALGAGLALGLIALTSMYWLYINLIVAVLFGLVFLLLQGWKRVLQGSFWASLAVAATAALPLVYLGVRPFLGASASGGLASRSLEVAAQYAASPTDYLLPFPGAWLWSGWVSHTYLAPRWQEQALYLGIVPLLLALLAWHFTRQPAQRRLLGAAALSALAALLLSLGVQLQWLGETLLVGGQPLNLPGRLLFEYAPFFAKMRVLARFGFFVPFFTALSAGLGAAAVFAKMRRQAAAGLAAALILLIAFDFAPHPLSSFTSLAVHPADAWLAQQPGEGALAVFPFRRQVDQDLVYRSQDFRKPYIGGFFSANYSDQYWQIQPSLDTFPSAAALATLRGLGVEWVYVEPSGYADAEGLRSELLQAGLVQRKQFDDVWVFQLLP